MKKSLFFVLLLTLLLSACVAPGGIMGMSDEVYIPGTAYQYTHDDLLVWEAFYCASVDCVPKTGRFEQKQINRSEAIGCPMHVDIAVGSRSLIPGDYSVIVQTTQQFFLDTESCVVREATDEEYVTGLESAIAFSFLIVGAVIAAYGGWLGIKAGDFGDHVMPVLIMIFGVLIMVIPIFVL